MAQAKVTPQTVVDRPASPESVNIIDPPDHPKTDPPAEPGQEPQTHFDHALGALQESLEGYTPMFRRDVLRAALKELADELKPLDELAGMEDKVRAAVNGLDLRTRAIVAMLAALNTMEGVTNTVRYGNDIMNNLAGEEETIKKGRQQFAKDPIMETLYRAYRLQERIDGAEDEGPDEPPTPSPEKDEPDAGVAVVESIVDKASGEVRRLVAALLQCTIEQKIAAVALMTLINGDTEGNIKEMQLYAGDIGDDLWRQWDCDLSRVLADPAACKTLDPETLFIASYVAGLSANQG